VLGSPKIQMANFLMKPAIAFPMIICAAILGALAGVLNIQGTPYSAGYGLSGFVGPLNYITFAEGGWTQIGRAHVCTPVTFRSRNSTVVPYTTLFRSCTWIT